MPADPGIEARRLVPTPRQVEGGTTEAVSIAPDAAPAAPEESPAAGRPRRLATLLAPYDPRTIRGPKVPILVFGLLAFFGQLTDLIYSVIAPEIRITFATGPALLGLAALILPIVQYLVLPFYGWLVDRVSRVMLLRVERIIGNALYALASFASSVLGMFAAFSGAGLLGLGASTPQATLTADYYESESLGRVATFLPAVAALATIIGPVLLGVLVDATNWRVALFVVGCGATIAGLSTLLLREPVRGAAERAELDAPPPGQDEAEPPPLSFAESWRAARSITTLRRIWYATPFQVASSIAPTYYVLAFFFSQEHALTATQRGYITSLMGVAAIVGLLSAGPLAGRLLEAAPGRLMTLAAGLMMLQALSLFLVGSSGVLALSIIATLPLAMCIAAIPPLLQMVTLKVVPPRMRGLGVSTLAPWQLAGLGLFYLAITAGGAGGPRATVLAIVPYTLLGAFFFATAAAGVARDVRAARASTLAHEAVREARDVGESRLLVCRGVEVTYGGTQVLFGVDLDVTEGEIVALLGTNGAGKSTLLRAIAGVHAASNGAILIDGRDVTHEPAHANAGRGVVMMPGGKASFPTLTVEENLRAAGWLYRDDPEDTEARLQQVLGFFPVLRERFGETAGNLSGGEQQMVGLGQAFMMKPRLLMIDELSLGLAPSVVEQLLGILRRIHAGGTTVLLVEQSLNVALTIASRAVFMEKGEVRFDGPTEELLRRPELVRSVFIGGAAARTPAARRGTTRKPGEGRGQPLRVEDVRVRFGGVEALRGASLAVEPGEVVGIIGPNGAGKTTLFDIISGFTRPDSGRVLLGPDEITHRGPDERARLGLGRSFQDARLFPALTVRENIAVALERRTVRSELMAALWLPQVRESEAKVFRRVDGLVELLGLEAFADKFASELSTGSRRAVEVACVMAAEPDLLLLDEPSSGLAQAETEALAPALVRMVRETGCGLLVIEHDIPLISRISDRLLAMELGAVISEGSPAEVLSDPRVLDSYLAASEGVVARSGGGSAALRAALAGRHLEQPNEANEANGKQEHTWPPSSQR